MPMSEHRGIAQAAIQTTKPARLRPWSSHYSMTTQYTAAKPMLKTRAPSASLAVRGAGEHHQGQQELRQAGYGTIPVGTRSSSIGRMARSASVSGRKRGSPARGVCQRRRWAEAAKRRNAVSYLCTARRAREHPQDDHHGAAGEGRIPRQNRWKASSVCPMRVPPTQSRPRPGPGQRLSRLRIRKAEVSRVNLVPITEHLGAPGPLPAAWRP